MSPNQTLNDLAVETLSELKEVRRLSHQYNDFGSILGVRDEMELIEQELQETLDRVGLRCMYLKMRIGKWEKGEHKVGML